jgi:hypothetical protein
MIVARDAVIVVALLQAAAAFQVTDIDEHRDESTRSRKLSESMQSVNVSNAIHNDVSIGWLLA